MSMNELANPWIQGLISYEPGRPMGELARELGLEGEESIVKLASNENSLAPSPEAVAAMKEAANNMHLYPDGGAFYLRQALAEQLDVEMEQIIVGNGSNELIEFILHVFLDKGLNLVMSDKAFIVYKLIAPAYQAECTVVPMKGMTHDLDAMLEAITPETRIVAICNPNNPTGTMVTKEELDRYMAKVPDHVVTVMDEAYIEFMPEDQQPDMIRYVKEGRNVIVLRTFSKVYGLAGLRIGYGIGPADGIKLLHKVRQPFNANAMAQVAALAALKDQDHVVRTRTMLHHGEEHIVERCKKLGLEVVPSVTNFMLIRVGDGRKVFEELQRRHHVIVRPMNGYGMPDYVRVTIGIEHENQRLMDGIEELVKEGLIAT
jgi:histidinol-phosphate aminotransferase